MDNSLLNPGSKPFDIAQILFTSNNGNEILFGKIISRSNRSFLIWNVHHLVNIVIQQLQLECLISPVVDKKKNNNSCEQNRNKDWKD
ncbi:hypothetical protein T09_11020 [Trichinella sp. T9]|nr:hypothetical protein T09_11020 [Trichinella sp. T9]